MRLSFLSSVSCVCLAAIPAEAARIAGIVVDSSGAPVPGATVTAGSTSVTTGDDGRFDFADAPDGSVSIRVTAPGFAVAILTVEGTTEGARVVLQPAPLVDTVVVTASRGAERLVDGRGHDGPDLGGTAQLRGRARSTTPCATRPGSACSAAPRRGSRIPPRKV